ncbi:hypothetical protein HYU95_02495 [Candidatus Daviesbacteria bacterium]|nr:hypothetical protein [Candidatus Daviesbacteria bacterium]
MINKEGEIQTPQQDPEFTPFEVGLINTALARGDIYCRDYENAFRIFEEVFRVRDERLKKIVFKRGTK